MMHNLTQNRINLAYPAADIATMKANANSTIAKIPTNITLNDKERTQGVDINVSNKVFVENALTELNSNGISIMPAWFCIDNLKNDLAFFEQSDELISIYSNIITRLRDAQRIAGREAYAAAAKAYQLYREAAEAGIPGAQESYNALKVRFERNAKTKPKGKL